MFLLKSALRARIFFFLCVAGSGTTTFSASLINLAPAADCTGDETLHLSPKKYSFCNRERFLSVKDLKPLLKGVKSSGDLAHIIEEYCNFEVLKCKLLKLLWFVFVLLFLLFWGCVFIFLSSFHFKPK